MNFFFKFKSSRRDSSIKVNSKHLQRYDHNSRAPSED